MYEHKWERTHGLAGDWYRCTVCRAEYQVTWMPGWPPVRTYFLASGEYSGKDGQEQPACTALPVDGLFREQAQ